MKWWPCRLTVDFSTNFDGLRFTVISNLYRSDQWTVVYMYLRDGPSPFPCPQAIY